MNILSTEVVVGGVPYGPIESERLAGPPVESDDAWRARHFAAVLVFCNNVGGGIEKLKTTYRSSGNVYGVETFKKAGWTNADLVNVASANVAAKWVEYPPDV